MKVTISRKIAYTVCCTMIATAIGQMSAQRSFATDDSEVNGQTIATSGEHLDLKADQSSYSIEGSNNTIRIHGDCKILNVMGNSNKIQLDRVGSLQMLGRHNHVSYQSGLESDKPSIASAGVGNTIDRISSDEAAPAATPSLSPESEKPSTSDAEPAGMIMLDGSNKQIDQATNGKSVSIDGSNDSISLQGKSPQLVIRGSNNRVTVEAVSKVSFDGSNNVVSYKSGSAPSLESNGSNNAARQEAP